MKVYSFLFKGLRGKLILTYTLVTVLALMALESILIFFGFAFSGLTNQDRVQYLEDVISTLSPEARTYMQPDETDFTRLQTWLDGLYASGYASLEPQDLFDSPAAKIVPGSSIYILSTDGRVLAHTENDPQTLTDQTYGEYANRVIQNGLADTNNLDRLYEVTPQGDYLLVVPVRQKAPEANLLGIMILKIESVPSKNLAEWVQIFSMVASAGLILLLVVVPFGMIFGFIMSNGLTNRLQNLAQVADRWAEGDFVALPYDATQDEIGVLSLRMRNMAESIQNLMQDRQGLAQMKERNRIAQELHDTVKQQNFATLMQVRAARNLLNADPVQAEKSLLEAESLIKSSQQELKLMISELRPAALDGKDLAQALQEYLAGWSANACIRYTFQGSGELNLPAEVEQILYRVAQEALSNVARHSRASAVIVRLKKAPGLVHLEVADNGVGFNSAAPSSVGFGLISMRERLAEGNGRLEITSSVENGTYVIAEIPFEGE